MQYTEKLYYTSTTYIRYSEFRNRKQKHTIKIVRIKKNGCPTTYICNSVFQSRHELGSLYKITKLNNICKNPVYSQISIITKRRRKRFYLFGNNYFELFVQA